jgi:hypothetical protein
MFCLLKVVPLKVCTILHSIASPRLGQYSTVQYSKDNTTPMVPIQSLPLCELVLHCTQFRIGLSYLVVMTIYDYDYKMTHRLA